LSARWRGVFSVAGFAGWLKLSPEMGALIAGVMVSTFPYTLDVVARVTSLRDFFVTLFFVSLGMTIPIRPGTSFYTRWCSACSSWVAGCSRCFVPLYKMKMGPSREFVAAINLCQISELSLVLLTLGRRSGDVSEKHL